MKTMAVSMRNIKTIIIKVNVGMDTVNTTFAALEAGYSHYCTVLLSNSLQQQKNP